MKIGKVLIGGDRVYVIAEAGVNHNGDVELAKKLIDAAQGTGADAVKFQTFTTEEIVTEKALQAVYQSDNTGVVESQSLMLEKLALSHEDFTTLHSYAMNVGIEFLSTPFSERDAEFLHTLGVAAYKVSSGDLTNLPFLSHIAKFGKPILLSTGMATLEEVREAIDTLRSGRAKDIIILQCTSEYPAPLAHVHLRVMQTLKEEFNAPVGYSDHTLGEDASIAAASLGAAVIEKHFTLDRNMAGPDHKASLEPNELKKLVSSIRSTPPGSMQVREEVLGSPIKRPSAGERATAKVVRKGIAARRTIERGEVLTPENIFIARPEGAIKPKEWDTVLGKRAQSDIPQGTSLSWDMLQV